MRGSYRHLLRVILRSPSLSKQRPVLITNVRLGFKRFTGPRRRRDGKEDTEKDAIGRRLVTSTSRFFTFEGSSSTAKDRVRILRNVGSVQIDRLETRSRAKSRKPPSKEMSRLRERADRRYRRILEGVMGESGVVLHHELLDSAER